MHGRDTSHDARCDLRAAELPGMGPESLTGRAVSGYLEQHRRGSTQVPPTCVASVNDGRTGHRAVARLTAVREPCERRSRIPGLDS
jgi:hypothetical protein